MPLSICLAINKALAGGGPGFPRVRDGDRLGKEGERVGRASPGGWGLLARGARFLFWVEFG